MQGHSNDAAVGKIVGEVVSDDAESQDSDPENCGSPENEIV